MSGNSDAFVGSIPKDYDESLGPVIFADYAKVMAQRITAGQASRVLETACGTGIVTRALRDALPATANLIATDLNADMLKVAQSKIRPREAVEFHTADGTALPFPDASFDAMVCQFGMMFYQDKDKGFREAHRVLAPSGRYLFSVWDAHRHNPFGQISHEVIGSFFATDAPQFYAVPFSYHMMDAVKESLIAAGFSDIMAAVLRREHQVQDFTALARGVVFGNPVLDQIVQRGGVEPGEVQDAVAAAMRMEFGNEPATMPLQAIIFEARKA